MRAWACWAGACIHGLVDRDGGLVLEVHVEAKHLLDAVVIALVHRSGPGTTGNATSWLGMDGGWCRRQGAGNHVVYLKGDMARGGLNLGADEDVAKPRTSKDARGQGTCFPSNALDLADVARKVVATVASALRLARAERAVSVTAAATRALCAASGPAIAPGRSW